MMTHGAVEAAEYKYRKPSLGLKVYATSEHYTEQEGATVGVIVAIEGPIIKYTDNDGDTVSLIWKFKDGYNKTVYFGD